jgi:AcrR family transcriptional regulator
MSTRDKILDAALKLVREQGVGGLTLEKAAKEAGLSKGGVLYHFNSKDDLVRGMVARMVGRWEELHSFHAGKIEGGPERYLKAGIQTMFDPKAPSHDPAGCALLAAITLNPALAQPWRDICRKWTEFYQAEYHDPVLAMLLGLAMDGLLLHDLVGLDVLTPDMREAARQRMLALIQAAEEER